MKTSILSISEEGGASRIDHARVGADELVFRVTSAETGGALLAVDVLLAAGGGPPALHRHAATEVYRVQSGALAIYVEDDGGAVRRIAADAGAVVPIPGGRAHTVRNESGADARAYVVFTPGDGIERFVRAADALARPGAPDPAAVATLARRHGIEMIDVAA